MILCRTRHLCKLHHSWNYSNSFVTLSYTFLLESEIVADAIILILLNVLIILRHVVWSLAGTVVLWLTPLQNICLFCVLLHYSNVPKQEFVPQTKSYGIRHNFVCKSTICIINCFNQLLITETWKLLSVCLAEIYISKTYTFYTVISWPFTLSGTV